MLQEGNLPITCTPPLPLPSMHLPNCTILSMSVRILFFQQALGQLSSTWALWESFLFWPPSAVAWSLEAWGLITSCNHCCQSHLNIWGEGEGGVDSLTAPVVRSTDELPLGKERKRNGCNYLCTWELTGSGECNDLIVGFAWHLPLFYWIWYTIPIWSFVYLSGIGRRDTQFINGTWNSSFETL